MDGQESVFDNETFHKRLGALAFAAILLTLLTVWLIELKGKLVQYMRYGHAILELRVQDNTYGSTRVIGAGQVSPCIDHPVTSWIYTSVYNFSADNLVIGRSSTLAKASRGSYQPNRRSYSD